MLASQNTSAAYRSPRLNLLSTLAMCVGQHAGTVNSTLCILAFKRSLSDFLHLG
jgi:hypothetical protein